MAILETLRQLLGNLGASLYELVAFGWLFIWHYILLIIWVVWWLRGVNWNRAWPFLAQGAWAPLLLLMVVSALVWSRIAPGSCDCLGFVTVANFWWQLGYVSMLVAIMLICGWLQGVFHWTPAEISLDPPAHEHGESHGQSHDDDHAHAHSHPGLNHGGHDHGQHH